MDDWMNKLQGLMADEESVSQLGELAQMLKEGLADSESPPGNAAASDAPPPDGEFDFTKLLQIGQLLGNTQTDDKNAALLLALRPHLGTERQQRLDRAVKLLKLYTIWTALKDSGMLKDIL